MTKEHVMIKLNRIFTEVFEDDNIVISDATNAKDIEDWDSLAHLQLIAAIEKDFKIHFTLGEINSFQNVGEMCTCMMKHLG